MQPIVFDDRYEFIPPHRGSLWPWVLERMGPWLVRREYGIHRVTCRGAEHLRTSLDAGHGIILAPNHCRPSDPIIMGELARASGSHLFTMASWSAFRQNWLQNRLIRKTGAFSVYREGMDRKALECATDILVRAERPLVIFSEGMISRTNDRLSVLQEGASFLARSALRQRSRNGQTGEVVIHPVAIKYRFEGDLKATLEPVLNRIETRLSWASQSDRPLRRRIARIAAALLSLKEIEYFDQPQSGSLYQRTARLADHLLNPLEVEWSLSSDNPDVVHRVRQLRTAILPDMVNGEINDQERDRRWRQLADCYLAQQLSLYPSGYLEGKPAVERLLETVERFEEDLTDKASNHPPLEAVIQVDHPISVPARRVRGEQEDPVMTTLRERLETLLSGLAEEIKESRTP